MSVIFSRKMKYFLLISLLLNCFLSGAQEAQHSFVRNKSEQDSTTKKAKKPVVNLWDNGKRMTQQEITEAMKMPNLNRRFQIEKDTVFMIYALLSDSAMAHIKKETEDRFAAYKNSFLNKPVPDFTVTDISGKRYAVSELKRKSMVLNFWFIACAPCRKEMPVMKEFASKYIKDPNLIFLSFALDRKDELSIFLEQNYFNYAVIPEASSIARLFAVNSYPTHIFIDKNGIIQEMLIGAGEDIKTQLNTAIQKIF